MIPKVRLQSLFSLGSLIPFKFPSAQRDKLILAAWVFFMYTVFSGALRKWYFGPGAISNVIFLGQLLMYFIFAGWVLSANLITRYRVPVLMTIYIIYLAIAGANPKNQTFYHGFFGIAIHLGFWVAWIAYYKRREAFNFEKLVPFFVVILFIEVMLASVQYSLPVDHILNVKASGEATDALVGKGVRVSGTFSYLAGFHSLIIFYGFLVWFLLILEYPFFLIIGVFTFGLYGCLMSGSRGSLAIFLLSSMFGFAYTGFLVKNFFNVALTFGVLLVLVLTFGGKLVNSFDQAYNNFQDRVRWGQKSGEQDMRLGFYYDEVFNFRGKYPVFGIGLGSTYQGANSLFGESSYAKDYGGYEYEMGRIILEGGYILFFLRIFLMIVLLRDSFIPIMGKLVIFLAFVNNPVVFNTYSGVFLLFGIMIVDRAYYLKAKNSLARATAGRNTVMRPPPPLLKPVPSKPD
jgi:hypothetical protein